MTPTPTETTPAQASPAKNGTLTTGTHIQASCGGCDATWPMSAGSVAHCGACHRTFNSVTAFDEHRVGSNPDLRRCMDEPELRDAGMEPNEWGRWRRPSTEKFWDGAR